MYEAEIPYFLTIRCLQGRLFLRPSERTNEVLGGVLARAARLNGVEVMAFVFASNHVHLLVRAPRSNISQFMQHLLTNISKKLDGKPRRFRWFQWSDRWRERKHGKPCARFDEKCSSTEQLVLSPVPHPAFRDAGSLRQLLERLIQGVQDHAAALHKRFRGRDWVLAQRPQHRPERPARSPRPLCHTSSTRLLEEFRERVRAFKEVFLAASRRWRSGDFTARFPIGANRPMVVVAA